MKHIKKTAMVLSLFAGVFSGYAQPKTALIAETTTANVTGADEPMQVEWRMYDHFTPQTEFHTASFDYSTSVVCGYDRLTHLYLPEYINPAGWSVEIFVKKPPQNNQNTTVPTPYSYVWQIDGIADNFGKRLNYHYSVTITNDGLRAILPPLKNTASVLPVGATYKMSVGTGGGVHTGPTN